MRKKDTTRRDYNPTNERIKNKYAMHIRRVGQKDEKTVLAHLKHIRDFEIFINFSGFEKFNARIADKYIQNMFDRELSASYISSNIHAIKDFLTWLERQRGYRSKIDYNHIDYLSISKNQRRAAKASDYKSSYKFEEIISVIRMMPDSSVIERRNKALVSLQALCSLRVSELRTVKIKNLVQEDEAYFIHVSPKSMSVKFAKTRQVVFMPLPADIIDNVIHWRDFLRTQGFKESDPLFPVIGNSFKPKELIETNIKHKSIGSCATIRNIFKKAFERAGLTYISPHSFRRTIAKHAEKQSPEFMNAVRQNLGHSSIDITFSSYGQLSESEQRRIISNSKT